VSAVAPVEDLIFIRDAHERLTGVGVSLWAGRLHVTAGSS
jgi:hypothetical protein